MADYYPLLARALDALPDRSPPLRRAVYDRARHALISQLRSLDPPLSEDDIDLERRALDAAIERLETDHGGLPAPANDAASAPPAPDPIPPPAPPPASVFPEPAPPEAPAPPESPSALPPAPAFAPAAFAPAPEVAAEPAPREPAIPIAARRPRSAEALPPALSAPPVADAPPPEVVAGPDLGDGPRRPRIAVVPPRAAGSRALRKALVGTALAAVIALIAVAAFLLRDKPQTLVATGTDAAGTQAPDGAEAKFGDRVSGEATPRQDPAARGETRGQAVVPGGMSVAQRAVLIEEAVGADGAAPTTTPGRVTWRLDTVNGEQGQPLQNAVVATLVYPDAGLTLTMTIQRNLDATLPASHTVNLVFSQSGADASARVVQEVGLLQAKEEEAGRGSPVSGLPVRVRENLFLIGLSSLRGDVERNTDLLLHRGWFDLAVRYASGRRAVLTFEKGGAGAQVMQAAFDAWQ